jgi:hypothetical protein
MRMHIVKRIAALALTMVALASLVLPAQGLAQGNSQCQAYNPQVNCEPPVHQTSGTLPFTGMDVVFLASGGVVLLAAGLGVRRLSRRLS